MMHTPARRAFKHILGQANHFLVTSLVALDCLGQNPTFQAPGLHAAWSPKSVPHSLQRSRIFVMHASLGSAADALDVYFSLMNRKPDYLQDGEFSKRLQACERSVYKKAASFSDWVPSSRVEGALVETLITWRNNVMHELADNKLSQGSRDTIRDCCNEIANAYCGLDTSNLAEKAERGDDLTLKETTSLIAAAQKFVEKADGYVLGKLDKVHLYSAALKDTLRNTPPNHGFRTRLFDTDAERWATFISNWSGTVLRSPSLSPEDLEAIRNIVPSLKTASE
jgi:hypothetical protein